MTAAGERAGPGAVIVGVGDELLYGRTVDTNGTWLAEKLSEMGFRVRKRWVVGDIPEDIQEAVVEGLKVGDLVILTGGLGPTRDDLTRPSVAEVLEAPLEEDPAVLQTLEAGFRARGYDRLPDNSRRMAQVPRGARVLENTQGAAPGLALEQEQKLCVLLPGPPREMKAIFSQGVSPLLEGVFETRLVPVHHRTLYTTGIPESLLARRMEARLPDDLGPLSIAYLPDRRGVRLRLTARGRDPEEAGRLFDSVEERLADILAPYRYESDTGDLAEAVGRALRGRGRTLAVAESCTGGLIAKRLTDIPGSSEYFLGGIVAYSNEVKIRELEVPEEVLEREGAVSREVAEAMARGAARRFGTQAGIGVTGVAGPGGGTEEKPVGTVWYAASLGDAVEARESRFPGDRDSVRERSAQAALALLFRLLEEEDR